MGAGKLLGALGAYAVLALLAWQTLSNQSLRLVTWVVLGGLAVKTLLHWRREKAETAHPGEK